MSSGWCCAACGWEWTEHPGDDPGPCGAHVGGRENQTPKAFIEYKRHETAGCFANGRNHMDNECLVKA